MLSIDAIMHELTHRVSRGIGQKSLDTQLPEGAIVHRCGGVFHSVTEVVDIRNLIFLSSTISWQLNGGNFNAFERVCKGVVSFKSANGIILLIESITLHRLWN